MTTLKLEINPLTRESFAPFGDVIGTAGHEGFLINNGFATRYDDLAKVDVLEQGGRPLINIFRVRPWPVPIKVKMLERHPWSSQAFVPLSKAPFLVLAAPRGDKVVAKDLRAFITNGEQGINFHRGVWHHPVLALHAETDFLVVDRGGQGENCEEFYLTGDEIVLGAWV